MYYSTQSAFLNALHAAMEEADYVVVAGKAIPNASQLILDELWAWLSEDEEVFTFEEAEWLFMVHEMA